MRPRLGPGPVFVREAIVATRHWQLYAGRFLFGTLLLLSVWSMWGGYGGQTVSSSEIGRIGESLYYAYVICQLSLILLVTPATTAGAICEEKAKGSLLHLLTTDLSDFEIVVGKLGARLLPVIGMMAAGVPILMIFGLLGGIDLDAVIGAIAVTVGAAVVSCAATVSISVRARKPAGALMTAYFALLTWLVLIPIGELLLLLVVSWFQGWSASPPWMPVVVLMTDPPGIGGTINWGPNWLLAASHPYWMVLAPYTAPGAVTLLLQFGFLGAASVFAALLTLDSIRVLRRIYLRQLGSPRRATKYLRLPAFGSKAKQKEQGIGDRNWLPGPSLDENPVLWREWHRNAPSLARRIMWHIFLILSVLLFFPVFYDAIAAGTAVMGELVPLAHGFTITFGLLLLSVAASSSLAEERARGSLDVLMTTPLPTRKIVMGKWWGVYRGAVAIALLPCGTCVVLAFKTGRWIEPILTIALILSYGVLITTVGLAMATRYSRQSRAIGVTVAFYMVQVIGWPFLINTIGLPFNYLWRGTEVLLLGTPWYGSSILLVPLHYDGFSNDYGFSRWGDPSMLAFAGIWILINLLGSGVLLGWILRVFNRRMGRMDLHTRRPDLPPPAVNLETQKAIESGSNGINQVVEAPSAARQT